MNFQALGNVYEVISVGDKKLVQSVPSELKKHHDDVLKLTQIGDDIGREAELQRREGDRRSKMEMLDAIRRVVAREGEIAWKRRERSQGREA
ncbi:vacuolar protein sorting-associated protein 22 1 [Cinnamomum micranthum f. kanehirae]|uniref:Vacuolar protein sorting-associated protein 22 1 n=1 Tax=Cinnamomum micranthum f. kanehirae TaxID=337451 RepID=A0A3S3NTR9_9MAGN|nr:vacuolar protein sorting-associated protein 22 1 [Cinnamomum micranthum f. kanehirae]